MIRDFIDKKQFCNHVNAKLAGKVHSAHVLSIISILFDELLIDLAEKSVFSIGNFGKFKYIQMQPRRYFDIGAKEIRMSKSFKIIRFSLFKKMRDELIKNLDIDKTFSKDKVDDSPTKTS